MTAKTAESDGPRRLASAAARYGIAAAAIVGGLAIKLALVPWVEQDTPFLLFFAAVLVAGWFGGLGPGLFATALAALSSAYFFMAPYRDIRVSDPVQRTRLAMFAAEGVFISALAAILQAAGRRADAATAESLRLERQLLEASDRARREVGHRLHDGLGQQLAGAAMRMARLVRHLESGDRRAAEGARAVAELLNGSVAWTRDLAHGLSPVGMRQDGLQAALEELAGHTERRFGVRCTFHAEDAADGIEGHDALHLYHIADEAAAHAAATGTATQIRLALAAMSDVVVVTVEDDARRPAASVRFAGGEDGAMETIRHRARMIGARLTVQPLAPHGTAVTCFYPRRAAPLDVNHA